MTIKNLQEKFIHDLGDIYDAEQRFLKGQEKMLKQASDSQLQTMITDHIAQTRHQIANLEQVFQLLGKKPKSEPCEAAKGLVKEAETVMEEAGSDAIRDCLIGGAAAKVEHYEIAGYRGLVMGAQMMDHAEILKLLQENLHQEEQTAQLIEKSAPMLLEKAMNMEQVVGR